jgi:hypothetical protein|nr:MAG TPA: major outer membrane lipoprotein [Bacteriophage sp.]
MSSTNKTTYYELSQYIGTDKPTYLGDYNSDMSKIDAGIHGADDKATTASQNAGSAIARVGVVEKTVETQTQSITTLQTNVSGLQESVKNAQSTASEASTKADSAQQAANSALLTANNNKARLDGANWIIANAVTQIGNTGQVIKVGFNKLLNLLSICGEIVSSTPLSFSAGQIFFTIPSNIMSELNLDSTVRIVGGLFMNYTANLPSGTAALTKSDAFKISPNGNVVASNNTVGTTFMDFNTLINPNLI